MKVVKCLFIGCFVCFIAITGLTTIGNTNEKSKLEGRELNQFPAMDMGRLLNTDYLNSITNAFSDQITNRENMIVAYNGLMVHVLKQKWVGKIAIGKENQLYQEPELIKNKDAYEQTMIKCASVINQEAAKITQEGAKFIYINYPRKDVVCRDNLPDFYLDSRRDYERLVQVLQSHLSDDVVFIDAAEVLENVDDSYYATDHHVNFTGQLHIYQKLMSLVQKKFPDVRVWQESDFEMEETKVAGSFNRRIGYVVSTGKEPLLVKPKEPVAYKRKKGGKSKPVFGETGNTYAEAFMGADYADSLVITKEEKKTTSSLPSVFITGSSYTNSMESLCVGSFRSMHSVDYRTNKSGKTLVDYVKEEKPDYVVFIPNQSDRHFSLHSTKIHLGLK